MPAKTNCWKIAGIVAFVAGALTVVGVVLWQYLPEDSKSSVQDLVNKTKDELGDVELPSNPIPERGVDDGYSDSDAYTFLQCSAADDSECCNGLASICSLRVDEILFAGVHNAHVAREDGFLLAPNHLLGLEEALEAGYRAINVDMANCDDGFQLVHGLCSIGTRSPTEVFSNIVQFLKNNPSEILLLNMQIDDEAGVAPVGMDDIFNLMYAVPGFTDMLYSHPSDGSVPWPTLAELVSSNQRILFFLYNGQEICLESTSCPAGFHDWFVYAAETEFSFASEEEVRDTANSCKITRGAAGTNDFFGVNVFVTLPNQAASQSLNTFASLQEHMDECSSSNNGLDVNVIFVDFWSHGDLPRLVQAENEKRAAVTR